MTSKERLKIALSNGTPDRVPCSPDISNMVPARLTNRSFKEIYIRENPPLWKAYLDAVDYYKMDAWFAYGGVEFKLKNPSPSSSTIYHNGDREIVRTVISTPKGDICQEMTCFDDEVPTFTEKYIKNFKEDFEKIKYLFPEIIGYDDNLCKYQMEMLGDKGLMAVGLFPAGFQVLLNYFNGGLEEMTYAYYDYPELFDELVELYNRNTLKQLEILVDMKVESILTGGSGSITLQSNELWDKMCLPTLKIITEECKRNGIITGVHSCGKEKYLIEQCVKHTKLDYVNPLEEPPMGDCNINEISELYGDKIAIMGNLHTTNLMLRGTDSDVRRESLKLIKSVGKKGGFVLSTADQCGRDTPDENIKEMVNVCKTFGTYPLDIDKIDEEINKLK